MRLNKILYIKNILKYYRKLVIIKIVKIIYKKYLIFLMDTDENESYEILYMLDRISDEFFKEINKLKKKLKFYEVKPEIRKCSKKFYKETLVPLFEEKKRISLFDIIKKSEKGKSTILNYLSELWRYKYIKKSKNEEGDKRTKLYEKIT